MGCLWELCEAGNAVWKWCMCLKESEMGILWRTERSILTAMFGVQLKDRIRSMDMILMLGLNEAIDQLSMATSVRWYGDELRREDGHILRRALHFEIEGHSKKGKLLKTWKKLVEEENVKIGLRRDDASRCKWSIGIKQIAAGWRWIWLPSLVGDTTML